MRFFTTSLGAAARDAGAPRRPPRTRTRRPEPRRFGAPLQRLVHCGKCRGGDLAHHGEGISPKEPPHHGAHLARVRLLPLGLASPAVRYIVEKPAVDPAAKFSGEMGREARNFIRPPEALHRWYHCNYFILRRRELGAATEGVCVLRRVFRRSKSPGKRHSSRFRTRWLFLCSGIT